MTHEIKWKYGYQIMGLNIERPEEAQIDLVDTVSGYMAYHLRAEKGYQAYITYEGMMKTWTRIKPSDDGDLPPSWHVGHTLVTHVLDVMSSYKGFELLRGVDRRHHAGRVVKLFIDSLEAMGFKPNLPPLVQEELSKRKTKT